MTAKSKCIIITAVLMLAVLLCGCRGFKTAQKELPYLTIGSDEYEPYNYIDGHGNHTGIDVELAQEVCRRIQRSPRFVTIKWDDKDGYLEKGEVDCLWGSFSMNGRENDYTWAGPYMYSRQVVVVHGDSDIQRLEDLEGKKVSVQSSTKPEEIFLDDAGNNGVPRVKNVYCLVGIDEVFAALRKGYVDACAGHEISLRTYMDEADEDYRTLDKPLMVSKLGVAFSKNSAGTLAKEVDSALRAMEGDGTTERILKKYGADFQSAEGGVAADENR